MGEKGSAWNDGVSRVTKEVWQAQTSVARSARDRHLRTADIAPSRDSPEKSSRIARAGSKSVHMTSEMIKAGEAVLDRACEAPEIAPLWSVLSAARDVYTAMELARRSQASRPPTRRVV
jgi:hypothetical protein